jgi:hypothetical protein
MSDNATPAKVRLTDGLGPVVAHPPLPEPAGSVYPEDGTAYVDAFTANQLLHYAGQCVRAATAECSEHWQAKFDAALNLWPRDCRLCAHFTTQTGGCTSTVQCVDSMQFKATTPRQYWIAGPNARLSGPQQAKET